MESPVLTDTFGRRLQAYMVTQSINQQELADRVGVSRQSVANYLSDKAPPSVDNLIRLSEVLKVTPNDLLGVAPSSDNGSIELSQQEIEMVRDFRELDERGKATIITNIHQQRKYVENALSEVDFKNYISRNSANITYPIFLQPADADYRAMKSRATELRRLKKTSYRSYEDVTKFLWDLGYGENICLAYVIQIFMGTRIISRQLFTHISTYLKHEVLYSFEE